MPKDADLIKPGVGARARAGLWFGPGSLAAVVLTSLFLHGAGADPDRSQSARVILALAMVVMFICHLFSLFELVGSLRGLAGSPRSGAALMLLLYWALIPGAFLLVTMLGN